MDSNHQSLIVQTSALSSSATDPIGVQGGARILIHSALQAAPFLFPVHLDIKIKRLLILPDQSRDQQKRHPK